MCVYLDNGDLYLEHFYFFCFNYLSISFCDIVRNKLVIHFFKVLILQIVQVYTEYTRVLYHKRISN